jgi:hypothetical protein
MSLMSLFNTSNNIMSLFFTSYVFHLLIKLCNDNRIFDIMHFTLIGLKQQHDLTRIQLDLSIGEPRKLKLEG